MTPSPRSALTNSNPPSPTGRIVTPSNPENLHPDDYTDGPSAPDLPSNHPEPDGRGSLTEAALVRQTYSVVNEQSSQTVVLLSPNFLARSYTHLVRANGPFATLYTVHNVLSELYYWLRVILYNFGTQYGHHIVNLITATLIIGGLSVAVLAMLSSIVERVAAQAPQLAFSVITGLIHGISVGVLRVGSALSNEFVHLGGSNVFSLCKTGLSEVGKPIAQTVVSVATTASLFLGRKDDALKKQLTIPELAFEDKAQQTQLLFRLIEDMASEEQYARLHLECVVDLSDPKKKENSDKFLQIFPSLPKIKAKVIRLEEDQVWRKELEMALDMQRQSIVSARKSMQNGSMAALGDERLLDKRREYMRQNLEGVEGFPEKLKSVQSQLPSASEYLTVQNITAGLCSAEERSEAIVQEQPIEQLSKFNAAADEIQMQASRRSACKLLEELKQDTGAALSPIGRVLFKTTMACDPVSKIKEDFAKLTKMLEAHQKELKGMRNKVNRIHREMSPSRASAVEPAKAMQMLGTQLNRWEKLLELWFAA
ncbi:hypothetical protein HJFPF1_03944 [Paramyrothecium foliicola]|nr:hypothetical protein HJFPF1_03944 [Paramyrothecium foliicola]